MIKSDALSFGITLHIEVRMPILINLSFAVFCTNNS